MTKALSRIAVLLLVIMFLLSSVSALADYARVVNAKMPVYSDPGLSKKLGTVPKWTIAIVKATKSDIALLNVNGKTCYAKTSWLATAHDISPFESYGTYRTANTCKLYAYPSTKSKSVTVKKGVPIETVAEAGNWILCRSMNGKYMAYIQRKDVMPSQ